MTNIFKDSKRGGMYFKEGKPYLSVTEILKIIDKPALRYWFGQQIYYAMVQNPSLDEAKAMASPYQASDTAKLRGTTVHSIIEAYKASGVKVESIPEIKPFSDAFFQWIKDFDAELEESEKTVFSEKYQYAGTLDLLIRLNGELVLVDVKTSKDGAIYVESYLQCSAYIEALNEMGIPVKRAFVLGLGANGKYNFKEAYMATDAFINCKGLYEFLNKEKLEKLGYLK